MKEYVHNWGFSKPRVFVNRKEYIVRVTFFRNFRETISLIYTEGRPWYGDRKMV